MERIRWLHLAEKGIPRRIKLKKISPDKKNKNIFVPKVQLSKLVSISSFKIYNCIA